MHKNPVWAVAVVLAAMAVAFLIAWSITAEKGMPAKEFFSSVLPGMLVAAALHFRWGNWYLPSFRKLSVAEQRSELRLCLFTDILVIVLFLAEAHFNFMEMETQHELAPIGLGFAVITAVILYKLLRLPQNEPEGKKIGGDGQ